MALTPPEQPHKDKHRETASGGDAETIASDAIREGWESTFQIEPTGKQACE
jgi:hypothetical protein